MPSKETLPGTVPYAHTVEPEHLLTAEEEILSYKAIGEIIGVVPGNVSRIEQWALRKLRRSKALKKVQGITEPLSDQG